MNSRYWTTLAGVVTLWLGLAMGASTVVAGAAARPAADRVVSVALGDEHGCALTLGGTVRCWGRNSSGQLGDGTRQDRARPTLVSGLSEVAQLAAFGARTCATRRNGTVLCWGSVGGLLADGAVPVFNQAPSEAWDRTAPQPVAGLTDVAQIAIGGEHLCALLRDGSVRCWGYNADGQLGDGTQVARAQPVRVPKLGRVTQLALGVSHSCALLADGGVRCWGANEGGQLGDRTTTGRLLPTPIPEFAGIAQLSASGSAVCARLANGTARCWGWNTHGKLGDGTTRSHAIPMSVHDLEGIREIILGSGHGCALRPDRTVWCWGDNSKGQLGNRERERSLIPMQVALTGNVVGLASAGQVEGDHACALLDLGQIVCWGRNDHGQLGRGSVGPRDLPALVDWPR